MSNEKNVTKKDFKPIRTENENVSHTVFAGLCKGCRICQQVCPVKCIHIDDDNRGVYNNKIVKVDIDRCIACGKCELHCPDRAVKVEKKTVQTSETKSPTDSKGKISAKK